jgi:hypothetical protein
MYAILQLLAAYVKQGTQAQIVNMFTVRVMLQIAMLAAVKTLMFAINAILDFSVHCVILTLQ